MGKKDGLFVVFEGLDGAGKTTLIKEIIEKFGDRYHFKYCKAVGSDNFLGKLAKKFAKTFLFIVELLYVSFFHIKPSLKKNKIVLQDRYDISVVAHIAEKDIFNQCLFEMFRPFFIKPDLLFYITVSDKKRIARLKVMPYSRFHQVLIDNPAIIEERKKRYDDEVYKRGRVIIIDTSQTSADKISKMIMKEIDKKINAQ